MKPCLADILPAGRSNASNPVSSGRGGRRLDVNRRRAVKALAGLGWAPFAPAWAQEAQKSLHLGFLAATSRPVPLASHRIGALPTELARLGYVEGRNLRIEWHFAEGKPERLPALAAELVRMKVDVIATGSDAATIAAQQATRTIPIVMCSSDDPVQSGFVKDLARPQTNITGLANLYSDLGPKQLEILRSAVPGISRVAVLYYSGYPLAVRTLKNIETAASAMRIKTVAVEVQKADDIDAAFQRMPHEKGSALIIASHPLFNARLPQLANAARRHKLPAISAIREFADAGGLISYGQNLAENYRHAAGYVVKIARGAKPGDLPVLLPSRLELMINQRTAKELGLRIPKELLLRADGLIE